MTTAAETAPMVSGILIDGQQPPAYQFAESGGVVAAAAPATAAPVASVTAMAMPIGWSPGGMPVAPAVAGIADPTGAVPDGQAIEAAAGPAPEKAEGVVTVGAPPRCLAASRAPPLASYGGWSGSIARGARRPNHPKHGGSVGRAN